MARKDALFTIGHSNHGLDAFLQLLRTHGVSTVADVRSAPYSRYCPHFSKEPLSRSLGDAGMKYVFLGRELGGRSDDPSCYENGRIRYSRLSRRPAFRDGIERLKKGAVDRRIAIMCAEREPLECHRTILVSPVLDKEGLSVAHIHAGGRLESHQEAMDRLLDLAKLPRDDLFRSREEIVAEALLRQEERVAYKIDDVDAGEDPVKLFTIGFTKKNAEKFFGLLSSSDVKRVVDVRLNNVSQLAGFAKRDDLKFFLQRVCGIDYVHLPDLAPTKEMLADYRTKRMGWDAYERQFLDLMRQRRIEDSIPKEIVDGGCLLCSEDKPHHCHRRLVAEYLDDRWGGIDVRHLG